MVLLRHFECDLMEINVVFKFNSVALDRLSPVCNLSEESTINNSYLSVTVFGNGRTDVPLESDNLDSNIRTWYLLVLDVRKQFQSNTGIELIVD